MEIVIDKSKVNTRRLIEELKPIAPDIAAISFANGVVRVQIGSDPSQETIDAIHAAVESHDAATLSTEEAEELSKENLKESSKIDASNIPGWATWSEAELEAWAMGKIDQSTIDSISDLASAKIVLGDMATALRAMARMVIALRNAQWPELGI